MKTARMHGCQNRFVLLDASESPNHESELEEIARATTPEIDGFLVVQVNGVPEIRMVYYDRDKETGKTHRAAMCGNGIRCLARYVFDNYKMDRKIRIITDDGPKEVYVDNNSIAVDMGPPREFTVVRENLYLVNTSLAHLCTFDEQLSLGSSASIGRAKKTCEELAYNGKLMETLHQPEGFHVNVINPHSHKRTLSIVTYEPAVNDITMACGTGAAAAGYAATKAFRFRFPVNVISRGGTVAVDLKENSLFLIGPAEYM